MSEDKGKEVEMESEEESDDMPMGSQKDYEVECAANDLLRAQEVKANPELYKKALAHLQKKKSAIESIADLKELRNKMMMEKDDA
jgi:hypothetical protein